MLENGRGLSEAFYHPILADGHQDIKKSGPDRLAADHAPYPVDQDSRFDLQRFSEFLDLDRTNISDWLDSEIIWDRRHFIVWIQIDQALAEHYAFTDEELDYIINYEIEYRMDRIVDDEEEMNQA